MNIEIYTSENVFEQLQSEWNRLLGQTRSNRIFLTWEWQSSWWKAYHPGKLWVIALRDDGGQLVGLAPWFIEQREKTGRTVRSIGCVDVTDYLEIIAHQAYESEVFTALAACVAENCSCYDTIDLCNIPETAPILEQFPGILEGYGFSIEIKPQEVCPVIDLPNDWEVYVNNLDKKQRHELRRKMRKLEGLGESVDWYVVDGRHDLHGEMETFLQLMRSASPDKATFLDDPQHVTFFREVTAKIAEVGWLRLAFLRIEGQYAAAYLNFDYNQEILVYNSGLNVEVASNLSPGIVLLGHLIKDAIERGYTKFDFLRGNELYKYQLGGRDTRIFMLIAACSNN